MGKKIAKIILGIIGAVLAVLVLGFVWLCVTEYRPADREKAEIAVEGELLPVPAGEPLTIVTWNVGYGALGDNADFFMDGGKSVMTADKDRVQDNMRRVMAELDAIDPEFVFLQEVDKSSARSHRINEVDLVTKHEAERHPTASTFSYNFNVNFIPYPIPPIGRVKSGILTLSDYQLTDAERVQLPNPFSWPVRMANLKRCLNVSRVPVVNAQGEDKELVLINLHLEAYDSGEGKLLQTKMLCDVMQAEREKGNYVIAGGDFNQTFSGTDDSMYPEYDGNWHCGEIDEGAFDSSWQFAMDNGTPTCRSLLTPYVGADDSTFQFYMIDGFIVSDQVQIESVETQDLKFVASDHNPVVMRFVLK